MVVEHLSTGTVKVTVTRSELKEFGVDYESLESTSAETRHMICEILRLSGIKEMLECRRIFVEAFRSGSGGCLLYVSAQESVGGTICCEVRDIHSLFALCAIDALRERAACSALFSSRGSYYLEITAKPGRRSELCGLLGEFGTVCACAPEDSDTLIEEDAVKALRTMLT